MMTDTVYAPAADRYTRQPYARCGRSGLMLPRISLGLWHSFGRITPLGTQRELLTTAFDCGITHFDLANNYGPPYGEAERSFGIHMDRDWHTHRDELVISTKAGFDMWEGPYGDHGSRKYLVASIDRSLKAMHLDYVDIFYHHRPDPDTPIEETMGALDYIVRSGRALYAGISNYSAEQTEAAVKALRATGTPMLIHQVHYNIFDRRPEQGLFDVLRREGVGCICFAPLSGGLLTDRYLQGIPADSRAARDPRYLKPADITPEKVASIAKLNAVAAGSGRRLSDMALSWVLRDPVVTSALIGASRPEQIRDNVRALQDPPLSAEELAAIDAATA